MCYCQSIPDVKVWERINFSLKDLRNLNWPQLALKVEKNVSQSTHSMCDAVSLSECSMKKSGKMPFLSSVTSATSLSLSNSEFSKEVA